VERTSQIPGRFVVRISQDLGLQEVDGACRRASACRLVCSLRDFSQDRGEVVTMKVLFTQRAYSSIVKECLAFPKTETGGILVGRKTADSDFLIPFVIGSGPKAKRSQSRFTPDVSWQQEILEGLFKRYAVNYLGSFHRHPGTYYQPSLRDYRNARKITSSPDWDVYEAIFPIAILNGGGIQIYPYYLSRKSKGFKPISWEIISNKHHLVRSALQRRKR